MIDTGLSERAKIRLKKLTGSGYPMPIGPYYDGDLDKDGTINLSTAENTLMTSEIISILGQARIRSQHLKYRSTLLRSSAEQLADLLPQYINLSDPVRPVTRKNSVLGPGVGALLANLIWTLCDEGEGVLLSTPYYHDYSRDIIYPGKAILVAADVPPEVDPLSQQVIPILRERVLSSREQGVNVRCLILCNPHNPIPRCYPRETMEGYISVAQEFGLHLIVDQIFANSVFPTRDDPHPTPFTSILSLPVWAEGSSMLQRVHVLGGPTKDLGCSGLKSGILVTENADVRQSVSTALQATPISGIADATLTELLGDQRRLQGLLQRNQKLLGQSMDLCADWATHHGFPYVGANSGVFFVLDLSPVAKMMGLTGKEAIVAIMRKMIENKVHINPMDLDCDPRPHRFRFIFAHRIEALKLAFERLETAFGLEHYSFPAEDTRQRTGHRHANGHR